MRRYLSALALLFLVALLPVEAQIYTIQPRPMQVDNKPRGDFSLSFRYGGSTNVRFEDVGSIASLRDIGDQLSEMSRIYDDGFVGLDSRGGAAAGGVADDGRTNRWAYTYASQGASGDMDFHQYSTVSNGTDVEVDSGGLAGIDMQYDMVFGVFGGKVTDRTWSFTWGGMASGVFSAINAKTRRNDIKANLVTVTDRYSLDGAVVPGAPYTAPSTTTVNGVDANGNPVVYTVDNTTLLNNRPYMRIGPNDPAALTVDGADIEGFWQVRGAYYTLRLGPWMRWQLSRRLSMRASLGATYTFLGVKMEYDEHVMELDSLELLRGGAITSPDKNERYGYFGAIDAEFWLTERTGFFAGVTVEETGEDLVLRSGEGAGARRAVVELPNGTGFRAGMTVLF